MATKLKYLVRKFHLDEEGLESLQIVMIIAIAGMVMFVAMTVGQDVIDWMGEQWKELKNEDITYTAP